MRFTERLPPPLAKRARDRRTYLGKSAPRSSVGIRHCVYPVARIPFLLRGTFPVKLNQLRTLAYALTVGGLYAMAEDKLIDAEVDLTPSHSLLVPTLYGEFIRKLHTLFPPASRFWSYHDRYFSEYQMAEIEAIRGISRTALSEYCHIAQTKSAPVKLALCGMAILSGRNHDVKKLIKSFDCCIIGCQFYDDVADWREDYLARRRSLVGARIRNLMKSVGGGPLRRRLPEIEKVVHSSDIIESMLEESGRWLARAEESVKGVECQEWTRFLHSLAGRISDTVRNVVSLKVNMLFNNSTAHKENYHGV
ncbi:MAG TPA: hypothetical protein VMH05_26660 [Bryobacteraceae bacterium]|nr:hypothetical protein [Bryobacteraceae bacterium]